MSRQKAGEPGRGSARPGAELADRLAPVVTAAVAGVGLELDELDVTTAGRRRRVRVSVDADQGVGLDEVAAASRAVSAALDDCDELLGGPYTLEVTSPGVDRPLTRPAHWRRARARLVRIRMADGTELLGRVGVSDADQVCILVGDTVRDLTYAQVDRATVEVEFRPPPKADLERLGVTAGQGDHGEDPDTDGAEGDGDSERDSDTERGGSHLRHEAEEESR